MATGRDFGQYARVALAFIRLINGGLALLAPAFLAQRVGANPETDVGISYAFRMFGIRTVLVGLDLFAEDSAVRSHAVQQAVPIHASDTVAAFLAARSGRLGSTGPLLVAISAMNTVLAFLAQRERRV
ncbi:MAG: hypothetical protein NVSMB2_04030 [Chloroflexota bacterium]